MPTNKGFQTLSVSAGHDRPRSHIGKPLFLLFVNISTALKVIGLSRQVNNVLSL